MTNCVRRSRLAKARPGNRCFISTPPSTSGWKPCWATKRLSSPGDVPGKIPGNQQGEGAIAGLDELRKSGRCSSSAGLLTWQRLQPAALDELVFRKSTIANVAKRFGSRRSDVLLHVCTHAQYTAAQVVNMLRHTGAEKFPDVMLIAMARQEAT